MRECGHCFGLALESPQRFRIIGQTRGQDFDGHFTIELGIQCAINFAHSASAHLRENPVAAQRLPHHLSGFVFDEQLSRNLTWEGFKGASRLLVYREKRLHFSAQCLM